MRSLENPIHSARASHRHVHANLLAIIIGLISQSAAALSFFPGRVVMDDRNRSAVLRIVNKKDVPQHYVITWQRMRMTPDSGLRPVPAGEPAPALRPARGYVLFAPRQAMIPPNSTQAVRLLAQIPADLPAGEYRSHLMITEPPRTISRSTAGGDKEGGMRMRIQVVPRTTLPVILRHGNLQVSVSIDSMRLRPTAQGPRLEVALAREGNRSVYADAEITWRAPGGENYKVFGPASIAIYTELDQRQFSHPLNLPDGRHLEGGELYYVLRRHPPHGGPAPVLIERRLRVP